MALLSLVLRTRFQIAEHDAYRRGAVSRALQPLRGQAHAVYAILSLVPAQGAKAVAGQAFPGTLRSVQMVGGFGVLELLSVVPAVPSIIDARKECER